MPSTESGSGALYEAKLWPELYVSADAVDLARWQ